MWQSNMLNISYICNSFIDSFQVVFWRKVPRYIRLQLTYPFFAPIFSSIFTCCYWAFPYTQLNALYSVLGIGIVYIGVLIGDSFYAIKRKTLPMWYRDLKMNTTFIALSGIFMLLYGIYTFPKETKHMTLTYPKTIQELKSEI